MKTEQYVTLDDFLKGLQELAASSAANLKAELKARDEFYEKERIKRHETYEKERIAREKERIKREKARDEDYEKERIAREASKADWELRMKTLDKKLGKVTNSLGDIVEYMLSPGILRELKAMGYTFNEMARDHVIEAPDGRFLAEIDAELRNGTEVMLVEIKTQPTQKHINEYLKKMDYILSLNKYPGKTLMAGMAGAVFKKEVEHYAIKCGLFVIKQSGDTMEIVPKDTNFKPRIWTSA